MATPSFRISQSRVPLSSSGGGDLSLWWPRTRRPSRRTIAFVHFLDSDKERMWTDDHDLPVPTSQWKPGQTIEYTKTMFVPGTLYGIDHGGDGPLFPCRRTHAFPGRRKQRPARLHVGRL